MKRLLFMLLPWGTFDVLLRSAGLGVPWGAGVALAVTIPLAVAVEPGRPGHLGTTGLVTFGGLLVAAVLVHGGAPFRPYARSLATGALGLSCLGSVPVRPWTTDFVAAAVSPRTRAAPEFRSFNRRWSLAAAAAFLVVAAGDLWAAATPSDAVVTTVCNWLLPLAMLVSIGVGMVADLERRFDPDEPSLQGLAELYGTLWADRAPLSRHQRRARILHLHRDTGPSEP